MTRQQSILDNFHKNFHKYLGEKILIYGKGAYARLIIENFKEYSFTGIIDRLDLEGSYYGIPVLKHDEVVQSGSRVMIIAASLNNTEIIRKRVGNFCIKNHIKLYSVDGRILNVDDCVIPVRDHESHWISQKKLRESIDEHDIVCFDLQTILMENIGKNGFFYTVRKVLIDDLKWAANQDKKVVLCIKSRSSIEYKFFCRTYKDFCDKLVLCEGQGDELLVSLQNLRRSSTNKDTFLFIGSVGECFAKDADFSVFRIYSPIEMLLNSSYRYLYKDTQSKLEMVYLQVIINHIFSSPYALEGTNGLVRIQRAHDIGYVFLGPIVLDFMFWFISQLKKNKIKNVIFSARDGYVIQKLYLEIIKSLELKDLPGSIYFYTSRRVCNMIRINNVSDINSLSKEYFCGNVKEMLINRFMLKEENLYEREVDEYRSDFEYIESFSSEILNKANVVKKGYLKYIEALGVDVNENTAFFDLFASGTCQLALSKLCNKNFKGLYFSRFITDDNEKNELDIESYLEPDSFMEDHSLFIESILTSLEPTLSDIGSDGEILLGNETRNKEELKYVQNAQEGIMLFAKDALKRLDGVPDIERDYARDIFGMLISQYTNIENNTFKNIIIRDEILNRNQYLGDFYKY